MLSLEKLANATVKNRVEVSQLYSKLNRIEKEKQNEVRMLNNEKQRFRAKYHKSSFTGESSNYEAAEVKMYETHNPGFCYKRNGEHRVLQPPVPVPPIDFKHLHFLLFTNGEVDIEKLLCLHLLSTHETNHLKPPKRSKSTNIFLKRESPVEQLIDRSNSRNAEITTSMILPTYVLDISKENEEAGVEDDRLLERFLVNEKILELITTVIKTLEYSNPDKVLHLMGIAQDPSCLKRIFRKPHIQQFVSTLKDHSLVSSCTSFVLTQPTKLKANHLEIVTPTGALEDLVKHIRTNVLQYPNRISLKTLQDQPLPDHTLDIHKDSLVFPKSHSAKRTSDSTLSKIDLQPKPEKVSRVQRSSINFVAKNIAAVNNFRKMSDQDATQPKRLSIDLRKKEDNVRKASLDSTSERRRSVTRRESSSLKSKSSESCMRIHLKQTTCSACMEKWKTPLPTPKVSKVTRTIEVTSNDEILNSLKNKNNSIQRISMLIEREQYKLSSYDRKYSNASNTSNLAGAKKPSISLQSSSDYVDLNMYDLEKIRQEIREKEAKKKLEKFLAS